MLKAAFHMELNLCFRPISEGAGIFRRKMTGGVFIKFDEIYLTPSVSLRSTAPSGRERLDQTALESQRSITDNRYIYIFAMFFRKTRRIDEAIYDIARRYNAVLRKNSRKYHTRAIISPYSAFSSAINFLTASTEGISCEQACDATSIAAEAEPNSRASIIS